MARSGIGRYWESGKKAKQGMIYIPANVRNDSRFPFRHGDFLLIKIEEDGVLVIKKWEGDRDEGT